MLPEIRIGLGIDSHRIEQGGPLILGGVALNYPVHLVGHSDADVILHAVTDAILSAAGLPDIGQLFPNDRAENRGRNSAEFLTAAKESFVQAGWNLVQVDCVLEMERPKISVHKEEIVARISQILDITPNRVGLRGKTGEGVGEIGRGELARATCIALACRAFFPS
jgi:2-C-methyl-D-erythritol 2,4-cyclodiphosphate synthase